MMRAEKQIKIAGKTKTRFNEILSGMFTTDIGSIDTPEANLLRSTLDRINSAPASWWIDFVGFAPEQDRNAVSQIIAAVAQNKTFAIKGIE